MMLEYLYSRDYDDNIDREIREVRERPLLDEEWVWS
jgi:hypothetical protein